jgi:hypothetical protein
MEGRGGDGQAEARRWHRFISSFLTELPELARFLADREIEPPFTPGHLWTTISLELLADDYAPLRTETDVWARLLRMLEVAEELRDLLEQATPSRRTTSSLSMRLSMLGSSATSPATAPDSSSFFPGWVRYS